MDKEAGVVLEAEDAAAAQILLEEQQKLFEQFPFLRDMLIEHGVHPLK